MAALSLAWRRISMTAVASTGVALCAYSMVSSPAARMQAQEAALTPKEFRAFKLHQIEHISHNTRRFRFKLEDGQPLGLTVASCLMVEGPTGNDGKPITRMYTPTTGSDVTGHFDLVIKRYENGALTPHIFNLKEGDSLKFKGPFKKLDITPNMKKEIGLIAGGTGITPMYQVVKELLRHPEDKTKLTLVFANNTEEDILLKNELDELSKKHPRFNVHYVVAKPDSPNFKGFQGHINKDIVQKTLPSPSNDSLILVCGPPGLMAAISGDKNPDKSQGEVSGVLSELGFTKDTVYKF